MVDMLATVSSDHPRATVRGDSRIGEATCCCEYYNIEGQRSHLMATCCDCDALDVACDRSLSNSVIVRTRINAMSCLFFRGSVCTS